MSMVHVVSMPWTVSDVRAPCQMCAGTHVSAVSEASLLMLGCPRGCCCTAAAPALAIPLEAHEIQSGPAI